MSATIEFIFDFGSPNAYLAYRALPPILERTGARLVINPCLLGGIFKATGNLAPAIAFGPIKGSSSTKCWSCAVSSPGIDSRNSTSTRIFRSTR
jgi:2-hydroxychromene-2-carboxylate isomerase